MFTVDVPASSEHDAFDNAADALGASLDNCGFPIDGDARWDDEATAGELDPDSR